MSNEVMSWLSWFGAAFGILGATLQALNIGRNAWGFVFYLVSNLAWIGYAVVSHENALSSQYLYFTAISVVGLYRWRKTF